MIIDTIFLSFLLISSYTDIKYRKVYNFISLPTLILGLGFNFFYYGFHGLSNSLAGLVAGFLFLFVFYLLGGVGAGDVKFMAVVGTLKGFNFVIMGGFYGAILGGFVAIIVLLTKKNLVFTLTKIFLAFVSLLTSRTSKSLIFDESKSTHLPYTVFLASGMIIQWILSNS